MIVLSCGHEVNEVNHGIDVIVKSMDRTGEKCLSYMVVCGDCKIEYAREGLLFNAEDVAYEWINTEEW